TLFRSLTLHPNIYNARSEREFVSEGHILGRLHDLKWKRHIRRARYTRQVTSDNRITSEPVFSVLSFLHQRLGSIRKRSALNDSRSEEHSTERAHRNDRAWLRIMGFDIPIRSAYSFP